jgi:hypothetical protein
MSSSSWSCSARAFQPVWQNLFDFINKLPALARLRVSAWTESCAILVREGGGGGGGGPGGTFDAARCSNTDNVLAISRFKNDVRACSCR